MTDEQQKSFDYCFPPKKISKEICQVCIQLQMKPSGKMKYLLLHSEPIIKCRK